MKEQTTGNLQPPQEDSSTLAGQLRHEAALAREDYLLDLRWSGRTTKGTDHRDLERVRLQYLRLLEGAEWAEARDREYPEECAVPEEGGNHGN